MFVHADAAALNVDLVTNGGVHGAPSLEPDSDGRTPSSVSVPDKSG
ncbi:MAG: hypothetical protein ACRD4I_12640 [Candidatus Angelobacter sp.]